MRIGRFSLTALLAGATGAAGATAQTPLSQASPVHHSRIVGIFDDATGDPIEGVRVGDLLTGTYATTTKTGTVSLAFLPEGGGMIRIQKVGYAVQTMFVAVTPSDTTPLTIVLNHVTELPTVVTKAASPYISPALRGFEERRKSGFGYFLTDSVLRKLENSSLGNVARRLPGVQIFEGGSNAAWLLPTTRCLTHTGPPQVYLDGVPLTPPMRPDAPHLLGRDLNGIAFNLNDFNVSDLAGIEYYPDNAQVPPEFAHSSSRCGVILLWTRER